MERIIGKCLEKEPENRYQSAKELAIDLRRLLTPSMVNVAEVPVAGRKLWKPLVFGVLILAAAAIVGVWYFRSHQKPPPPVLTEKDTIVLADFDNKTGDPVFDDTLKQGLSVQLEQSPFLDLISERKVNETLKLMGRPAGDRLTPDHPRGLPAHGQQGHADWLDCRARQPVRDWPEGGELQYGRRAGGGAGAGGRQGSGAQGSGQAAVSLRSKLGESLSSVQKYATPLEEATTPSLEALKAYSLGQRRVYAKGDTAALPFFKRAVELDPNFAMAYARWRLCYCNLDEVGRAAENARKAYELREKVSERERFSIEGIYYWLVTGELEKAAQIYELWQQTYPRDDVPYVKPGSYLRRLGNWEKALEECREALRLEPNDVTTMLNLGYAYMSLNRLDEAETVYKQAEERKLESELLLQSRYQLAFLKDDTAQMAQLVSAAMGKPGTEDLMLATQADTEGWYGKLKNARELTRRAMDSAQHNDAKETAAAYQAAAALREVEVGKPGAGACRRRCGIEAGSEPRCAGHGGAGPGAGRRYGSSGEAGCRTRQDIPAGHDGSEVLAAHDPGGGRLGTQRPEPGNRTIEGGEHDRT